MGTNLARATLDIKPPFAHAPPAAPDDAAEPVRRGGYPIRIDGEARWFYHDQPLRRPELIALFANALRRDETGHYWLVTPGERGRIIVEDVPFLAVELYITGHGPDQEVRFRTNLDEWVTAGHSHPIRMSVSPVTSEPRPYIIVKDRLEARITRSVYYELVERCVRRHPGQEAEVGIWSRQTFFTLGALPGV